MDLEFEGNNALEFDNELEMEKELNEYEDSLILEGVAESFFEDLDERKIELASELYNDLDNEIDNDFRNQEERDQIIEHEFNKFLDRMSLSELNTLSNLSSRETDQLFELSFEDAFNVIKKLNAFELSVPLNSCNERELEYSKALELNTTQKEIDMSKMNDDEYIRAMSIQETTEDLREIYSTYYDYVLKDKIKDFILDTETPEILFFSSRLKTDASAYRSITFKDDYNMPNELNDIIGLRFVVNDERDARKLTNQIYMKEIKDSENFSLKHSRDYFVTPKVDLETGSVQYRGLHLILQDKNDSFFKFEIQIHTKETYRATELTHRVYEERKRQKRKTAEIDFSNIQ